MNTSDFDYQLPQECIAQYPIEPRDASRLLILNRWNGVIEHAHFYDLPRYLNPGDLLVLNETRVIPARLYARKKPGGGKVELLLLNKRDHSTWEVLVGGKGLTTGKKLQLLNRSFDLVDYHAEVIADLPGARRMVTFSQPVENILDSIGHVPLPPYIRASLPDPERYQTVYAQTSGSAAAPTAGLHFTPRLVDEITERNIKLTKVTLHVGLDTFAPVNELDPRDHHIHTEWCEVTEEAALIIKKTRQNGGRIIAVGTTSVRTIESAAVCGEIVPISGPTDLFILPGYKFKIVDGMITNFHLPRSTLIMLVSAFAGREHILNAYETARRDGYRFYSFGDAMLIN